MSYNHHRMANNLIKRLNRIRKTSGEVFECEYPNYSKYVDSGWPHIFKVFLDSNSVEVEKKKGEGKTKNYTVKIKVDEFKRFVENNGPINKFSLLKLAQLVNQQRVNFLFGYGPYHEADEEVFLEEILSRFDGDVDNMATFMSKYCVSV